MHKQRLAISLLAAKCARVGCLCFPAAFQHNPRIQALVRLLRGCACRRLISEPPCYNVRDAGKLAAISFDTDSTQTKTN